MVCVRELRAICDVQSLRLVAPLLAGACDLLICDEGHRWEGSETDPRVGQYLECIHSEGLNSHNTTRGWWWDC